MTSNLPPEAQFPAAKRQRGNPNWVKGRKVRQDEPKQVATERRDDSDDVLDTTRIDPGGTLLDSNASPIETTETRRHLPLDHKGTDASSIVPKLPSDTYPLGGDEARLAAQAEVLERRLRDPEGRPAPEITLKNPRQMPRWFNTLTNQGQRIWTAKEKGYIFVRREDVTDLDLLGLHGINADGAITRGLLSEQEVLMSIDRDMFHAIRRRKEAIESARFKSQTAIRSDLANSAAAKFGDEAGTTVHQMVGQILDTKDQEKL